MEMLQNANIFNEMFLKYSKYSMDSLYFFVEIKIHKRSLKAFI